MAHQCTKERQKPTLIHAIQMPGPDTSLPRMIQPEPFNRFRFRRYARELSEAILELSKTSMSIQTIREALKHIPGAEAATMQYGQGGATQIFTIGDTSVEVGPNASTSEIEAAFVEAKKKLQN